MPWWKRIFSGDEEAEPTQFSQPLVTYDLRPDRDQIIVFFFILYAARVLGVERFGQYAFAVSLVAFFTVLADFGINTYQTSQVAMLKEKEAAAALMADAFNARLILSGFSLAVLIAITWAIHKPPEVITLVRLLALAMVLSTLVGTFTSTLCGYERFGLFALLGMITQSITTLTGMAVLALGFGLIGIGGAQLFSVLACFVGIALVVHKKLIAWQPSWSTGRIRQVLKAATPLGLTTLLTVIYYRAAFMFLSHFHGDVEVGYYNSAYALVNSLLLMPTTFSMTILPRMSEYAHHAPERLDLLYQRAYMYMLYLGLAVAVGIAFLANPIYGLLYPDSYLPGRRVLQILVWALALMFVNALQGAHLVARGMRTKLLLVVLAAAIVNIAGNCLLVVRWGRYGAAIAAVAAEMTSTIGGFWVLRRFLPLKMALAWLLRLFPALAAMALLLHLTATVNLLLRVASGAAILIAVLFAVGGLRRDDLSLAAQLWPKRKMADLLDNG